MNRSVCRLLAAAVLALLPADVRAQGVPEPLGYIEIPDLRATLSRMEAMVAFVSPGSLPPGSLAAGLAAKVGDPGLAGLGQGPLVVQFMVPEAPLSPPGIAVFVPVADAAPYEKAMTAMGWTTRREAGLLVGASRPALLSAPSLEADYHRLAREARPADARLVLHAAHLMDAYGPLFQLGVDATTAKLKQAPTPHDGPPAATAPAGAIKLLQLEMRAILLLMNQTEELQVELDLQPDALASDMLVRARPRTALAELASAPPPAGANGAAVLLTRPGFMTATYQLDGPRLAVFAGSLARELGRDTQAGGLVSPTLLAMIDQMGRAFTGEAAVAMGPGADQPLAAESVMKVTDEEAALDFMEKAAALLKPGAALHELYADLGLSLRASVRRNARRRGRVAVHRFAMAVDARDSAGAGKKASEDQKALQAFVRDLEFAFVRGFLVSTQDPAALDAVIDRAVSGRATSAPELHSARAFGEGRHVYVDYDLFGLMRSVMSTMRTDADGADPLAGLPPTDADPILYALSFQDGNVRVESRIPLRPFALMAQALKKPEPAKMTPPR